MDLTPPLDTVYQAVRTLYHDPDTSKKEVASLWLQELQKSVYSWKVADEMLHEKRDLESCYFAAQTMRSKIQLSFHELPTDSHNSLRDSLLEHMTQVNMSTNVVIVTQLCLALADLALQMASWHKPVIDLLKKFSHVNVWPLLEILTVLPEEVNSRSLRLGSTRREEVKVELTSSAGMVAEFLVICLTGGGDNAQIHTRILRCFTSWVSIRAITLADVADSAVVGYAFQILANHQAVSSLHESATDCVCTLLQCLEDNNNQQELEHQLFSNVVALEESFHLSVAHEDQEKSLNYCRIFTELAESFLEKILLNSDLKPHFAIKICDLVLICVGHHDYEVAEITFNLWFRISEELYQKNNDAITLLFKPYVERLIAALCKHCQMEPDNEGLVEEGDDFADFRLKVSELIKDVVFIVGSSNCFRQMFLGLQQPGVTWDATEASLFIMQAVAKNILPEENEVVPKVVEAILGLPENTHFAVRHTSVRLIGELCEWIDKHPQSLEPVLNFLLYCLQQAQLAGVAAGALQSVCSACRAHMAVHFNGLLQIVQSLETFTLPNEASLGLLKGVALIVAELPADRVHQAMRDVCWCQITPLCTLMENHVMGERGSKTDPCMWLDRLATIFRSIQVRSQNGTPHPCLGVITEALPILSTACIKYQTDLRVCERLCRCLRFALRCVSQQVPHLVPSIVEQIVGLYQMYRFSCFLYLGSILVDEYAASETCVHGLYEMLSAFLAPTFDTLQQPNGLVQHPDTVDDFFRLCARFIQRNAVMFLRGPCVVSIIRCAILCIPLDHRDANQSVMKFLLDFVHSGRQIHMERPFAKERTDRVLEILDDFGQDIITALISACCFSLHSYMFSDVGDLLHELRLYSYEMWVGWSLEAMKAIPYDNPRQATLEQVSDFHRLIVTTADTPKKMSHALRDFAKLYR